MIRHKLYNVDRSSGNRNNEKRRKLPMLGSDSSSIGSGATEEDPFTLEVGWRRSSKDTFRIPVKKLLADEMSKEAEMKKRSPGIIAKLMGLDGMPPPRFAYNEQKCSSEGYPQRCISKEKVGRRKSLKYHQEFKDVFEVLETSKIKNSRNPDQRTPNFELAESDMAFIRQKFLDAKRLSTDENSHDSREFHDALDALDSNRDLLLKLLHQPSSRFDRHLHDLQYAGSCSGRGCSTAIESLDNRKCDYPMFRGNSKRGASQNNSSKSHYNQRGARSSHSDSSFSSYFSKSSQILERNEELEHHPTRIVVLKPNIGKVKNARNIACQSHSFQESLDPGEIKIVERTNKEFRGRKVSPDKKVVSREFPNGKTRQMRNGVISKPQLNLTCSNFQGYAGDESSCSLSGNESAEEPVVRSVNVRSSSNSNVAYRQSSSRRKESSISREAKKRLTARWKSSRNSKDKEVISRGSTLADMLASNDKEVTLAHSDARITEERFADKFFNDDHLVKEVEPEGISSNDEGMSSNDGWKDDCSQLTKSRSLPALTIGFGSPKTVHRSNGTNTHLISKTIQQDNNKAVKNQFDKRESNGMLLTSMEFEASCSNVDVGDVYTRMFSETPDELAFELSEDMSMVGNFCVDDRDNTIQEEELSVESPAASHISEAAPESLASSKEADQPSPVSVLEPAFRDDLSSSSECFESVSSDLQGLRMQLRLLKLESEPLTEGSMLISSNEDATELSSRLPDDKGLHRTKDSWEFSYLLDILTESGRLHRTKDSWEFSYLLDILTESGLNDANPGALLATLYSSNCPISPKIFEQLEKKQSCCSSVTRSDRRLLFDCISSGILAIGQQFSDPHPWVRPSKMSFATWATENELQNRLCKFLDTQIVRYDIVEESDRENLGDEIDVIGKEIERLMINELLAEVVFDVI